MTSVSLDDDELLLLDGRCSPKVQAAVAGAKVRAETRAALSDLDPKIAGFIGDAVTEAVTNGRLIFRHERISYCSVCGKSVGYAKYKSGPRRGESNLSKPLSMPAVDLAYRFVRIQGHVTVGACADCYAQAKDALRARLAGLHAELPDALRTDGVAAYKRYEIRRCPECDWVGDESEMHQLRTIMGDGTYPGGCPRCDFKASAFGKMFKIEDGFVVKEVAA